MNQTQNHSKKRGRHSGYEIIYTAINGKIYPNKKKSLQEEEKQKTLTKKTVQLKITLF